MRTDNSTFASSEEQFRLLMDSVTDYAIFVTDCEGRIVTWNTGAEHIFGWSEEEMVGQSATIIWTPEDRANGEAEREQETAATEGRAEDERWHLRKDGSRFWASGILTALRDETGNVRGYCKILRDLTEPKRDEQRLQSVFHSQVVGVIFWNLDTGLITDANDTFLSMVGYTREDLEAGLLNFRAMTPPEWTERNEEGVAAIRGDGAAPTYEKEYFRKDGSRVSILIGGTRFEDSGSEGFSYVLDITERKLSEERERTRLNDLFTHVPAFMASLRGPNHIFEMENPSFRQLIGHREVVGRSVAESMPEVVQQGFIALLDRVYQTGEPFVGSGMRVLLHKEQSGPLSEHFLDFVYHPLRGKDGAVTGILIHGTDVTELKRLEIERRRGEERFRSLVEATAQIIWEVQDEGTFVTEQPQWAAYTGQTLGEYKGVGWLNAVHPDDREKTQNAWEEAVRTRSVFRLQHRLRRHDGAYRHFSVRAAPVLESDGSVREWIGVHNDVTERKEAESREHFLSETTARMRSLLDPEEVLYETAKAVGEYTGAHRCLYIEVDEDADTLTIRRDYVNGVASIAGTFPLDSFGPPIIENLRLGNITQSDDIEMDPRLGPEHRATFRALDFRAFLGVPLHKAGRWVAILAIHYSQARPWTTEEAELLTAVVERTWLAVENARLYRTMQEVAARNERIAETLQRSMLVTPPSDSFAGIELATKYEAAWDEAQIGGDFHDVFGLASGRVALVVGDATGKGLEAAAHTAEVKYALRAYLHEDPDPAVALERLNRFLIEGERFDKAGRIEQSCVAVCVTVLDTSTGEARCASAGAEPPLLVRAETGVAEEIYVRGALIGAVEDATYDAATFTMERGDHLVMTTDGITEARNPANRRRFFSDSEYIEAAQEGLSESAVLNESAVNIMARAKAFAGGKLHDDACLLLVRRKGL